MQQLFTKSLVVENKLGLHTRVCAKIVDCACQFRARIVLSCHGKSADAQRIIEVMSLGAAFGEVVEISVEGVDAEIAMRNMSALFESKFGE